MKCEICGKVCRNQHGLKIHKGHMHKKKRTPPKGLKKEIIALRDSIEDLTEEVHSLKENRVKYVRESVLSEVTSKHEH